MDREDYILALQNSGFSDAEAERLADDRDLLDIADATRRREATLTDLELLSRHLDDPEGNPL
jgi:hypothetical protein